MWGVQSVPVHEAQDDHAPEGDECEHHEEQESGYGQQDAWPRAVLFRTGRGDGAHFPTVAFMLSENFCGVICLRNRVSRLVSRASPCVGDRAWSQESW